MYSHSVTKLNFFYNVRFIDSQNLHVKLGLVSCRFQAMFPIQEVVIEKLSQSK